MAKRKLKKPKLSLGVTILLLVLFAVGAVGGFFGYKMLTSKDKFELVGDKTITLKVGEEYEELGVVCISFGKDISDKVKISGVFDFDVEGMYNIQYTIDDIRFGNVRLVRTIIVEVDDEI